MSRRIENREKALITERIAVASLEAEAAWKESAPQREFDARIDAQKRAWAASAQTKAGRAATAHLAWQMTQRGGIR